MHDSDVLNAADSPPNDCLPHSTRPTCRCDCARAAVSAGQDTGSDTGSEMAPENLILADEDGDEGVESDKREVGDLGIVSVSETMKALARHHQCRCQLAFTARDSPPCTIPNSLAVSGILPSESMIVERDRGNESTRSSLTMASTSSSSGFFRRPSPDGLLDAMGAHLDNAAAAAATSSNFHRGPLMLAHKSAYCFNMVVGGDTGHGYPSELSSSQSVSALARQDDFW